MVQDCKPEMGKASIHPSVCPSLPLECLLFAQQLGEEADSTSKMLLLCDLGILRHAGTKAPGRFICESLSKGREGCSSMKYSPPLLHLKKR